MRKLLALLLLLLLPGLAQAAITAVGSGTAVNAIDGGGGGGITPTRHASTTEGDFVLCLVGQKNGNADAISASGYTKLYDDTVSSLELGYYGKIMTASESDPTFLSTDTTAGRTIIGQCKTYRGTLNTVTGIVAHSNETNGTGAAYIGTPALTVTTDNTLVVAGGIRENQWAAEDIGQIATMSEIGQPERTSSATVALKWDDVIQTTATNVSASTTAWLSTVNTADYASLAISIKPAAAAPTWSVTPSVSAQDTNDYTLNYTPSVACTFYTVACKKDQTAPTETQVKAGNCTGDVAAVAAANEAVTGADTTVLGGSLTYPLHDLYSVCNNAGGDTALSTLADEMLDAPTGYQYDLLASVSATSPCADLNVTITPDIAAADVTKWPTTTSPSGYAFTAGTDCETQYTDPAGTRQTATLDVYDTSAGDWMSGGPTTVYFNNTAPACTIANCEYDSEETLVNSVAMANVDMATWFSDADSGDVLTITTSDTGTGTGADKRPAGTSISSGVWSGTPSCASGNTSGSWVTTATDQAGDTETVAVTWICYDQVAVPDCAGIDVAGCDSLANAVNLSISATFECSDLIAINGVISQGTAATTQVNPFTSFNVTAANGACTGITPWATVFLDDATAVPAGSVYISGAAYSQAGAHYVAAIPGSGVMTSISGLKYRNDGALIINVGGTIVTYTHGIAQTNLGETVAALCSPDYVVAGVPMDPDGTVCMTDVN